MNECDLPSANFAVSTPPLQNRVVPLPSTSVPCPAIFHLIISPPRGRTSIADFIAFECSCFRCLPPLCFRVRLRISHHHHSQSSTRKPARLRTCSNPPSSLTFLFVMPSNSTTVICRSAARKFARLKIGPNLPSSLNACRFEV